MERIQTTPTSALIEMIANMAGARASSPAAIELCLAAKWEIDRRFPVRPAPVSGWQPIESAPTNREVLIYTAHHLFDVALKEPDGQWWPARSGKTLACAVLAWMPLPEVPR